MKCLVCRRKFNKKYPRNGTVIQVNFSHSLPDGIWDLMGDAYICSMKCYKKLTDNEELLEW